MHPAWQVPEIRDVILTYLDSGDLRRLAPTCRDIYSSVTDRLWVRLTSLEPLLRHLPSDPDLVTFEQVERLDFYARKVKYLVLERPHNKGALQVPLRYRPKVKDSAYGARSDPKPWQDLWKIIAQRRPTASFLPNLQCLRVDHIVAELLRPLVGITGSRLTYVHINLVHERQPEDLIGSFLHGLQDTPKLEYLCVRDGLPDAVPSKLIERAPLKNLRLPPRIVDGHKFAKYVLSPQLLRPSRLERLTIALTREWYGDMFRAMDTKYLSTLKHLWLNLRTFRGEACASNCINNALGWTCSPPQDTAGHARADTRFDCWRRPPSLFIRGFDSPELQLLNIKFHKSINEARLLDTIQAVADACRLHALFELVLSNGGETYTCGCNFDSEASPMCRSMVWKALEVLGPLPQLKVLRLPMCNDLLKDRDMDEYIVLASGFSRVQHLTLGHGCYSNGGWPYLSGSYMIFARLPLKTIAAFCHLLPDLIDLEVGCIDTRVLEASPNPKWACPSVRKLRVHRWICYNNQGQYLHGDVDRERLMLALHTYFPNSDLVSDPDERFRSHMGRVVDGHWTPYFT